MPAGRCPRCGLHLDPLSGECPYCARRPISPMRGRPREVQTVTAAPRSRAGPSGRMLIWAVAAAAACLFIWLVTLPELFPERFAGTGPFAVPAEESHARPAESAPVNAPLGAEDLLSAVESYPGPGAGPHLGNMLEVTGTVMNADTDAASDVWIYRRADGLGVLCAFADGALDPAEPLRTGESVVVYGRCERYDPASGVRMTECQLVSRRSENTGAMGAP